MLYSLLLLVTAFSGAAAANMNLEIEWRRVCVEDGNDLCPTKLLGADCYWEKITRGVLVDLCYNYRKPINAGFEGVAEQLVCVEGDTAIHKHSNKDPRNKLRCASSLCTSECPKKNCYCEGEGNDGATDSGDAEACDETCPILTRLFESIADCSTDTEPMRSVNCDDSFGEGKTIKYAPVTTTSGLDTTVINYVRDTYDAYVVERYRADLSKECIDDVKDDTPSMKCYYKWGIAVVGGGEYRLGQYLDTDNSHDDCPHEHQCAIVGNGRSIKFPEYPYKKVGATTSD